MSDQFDRAQALEEFDRDRAIEAVTGKLRCEAAPAAGRLCGRCADPIDPERLQAVPGARFCLFCQEARERQERVA